MRSYKALFFSLIFSVLSVSMLKSENQPTIDHITSNNGLSHNTIRCMLQDTTGFLWFGSLNGLNRYDGHKIKTLNPVNTSVNSLSSGKIKELYQDSRGYIWVRTYSDIIHCYNPYLESFLPLFSSREERQARHNLFYEDKEKNVWLGGAGSGCVRISFSGEKIETKQFSAKTAQTGIASDTVNDIFEDSKLNVWILTSNGISLYENGKIKLMECRAGVSQNFLKAYEAGGKIYFIADNGYVIAYDPVKKKISDYYNLPAGTQVYRTAIFGKDRVLIATSKGVFMFLVKTGQFLSSEMFAGEKIGANAGFQKDKAGNLWIYNFSGNVWLVRSGAAVKKLNLIPPQVLQLIDEERYQFLADRFGNVWITTYGNGLFRYTLADGKLTHFAHDKNSRGISSNYLLSIALDRNDNIWVGTESMGINKLSFANRGVQMIYPDGTHKQKNGNVVRSLFEDRRGNIWVGTKSGSLYRYNADLSERTVVFENGYNVYSLLEDNAGNIWIATRGNGLLQLPQGQFRNPVYHTHSANPGSLSSNSVFSMIFDRRGRLWTATFGGGVSVKLNKEGVDNFKTFFDNDEWIRFARYVFEDNSGDIWVATTNGILRFNPDSLLANPKAYSYYTFDPESDTGLSNPEVRYIFQDSKNNIWMATAGGGLNKFVKEKPDGNAVFEAYRNQQGIANDNIMSILEDGSGMLWVSTESGLHMFNPETHLFRYFRFTDDFSSNTFSESTAFRCRDGRLLWGSLNGFYAFHPSKIHKNPDFVDKVILTGFFIYDVEATIGEKKAPLKKSVSYSEKIVLNASDKVFHIEFSTLNFSDPKANQFMYILENYEKRWNSSGAYNIATYRNVPPGKYVFRVKSVNSDGVWSENETTLRIVIRPPFWASVPAYIVYFILLLLLAYFAFRLVLKFNRLNNAVKVERQLTDYKLRFFTNISHEFRTPLTLIRGSVDTLNDIKQKLSSPMQQLVGELDKNTSHMMRLIEQLLEFRKLQNNKQKLNLQKMDAVAFLKDIYDSFSNVAVKMNIDYRFVAHPENIEMYIDANKVDKIVFNLLSNAFKFTPRGGKITLMVDAIEKDNVLRISLADNGIGVPREKQNLLFSRFMQINFSASGTGIGLSLVNEFTALHKGTVKFAENEGGGSVFTVLLPLGAELYEKDEFVNDEVVVRNSSETEVYRISDFIQPELENVALSLMVHEPVAGKKYRVLVIDDNDDIREFLTVKLSPYFEVITAVDGNEGIQRSTNEDPDLIICDVMMPGMNGFELTKMLKDNFATCHIPVILLTAYVSDEHHTEGVEAGADAYISKPFSMKHLMLQINKLLEKRELLHKHYSGSVVVAENAVEELDESTRLPEKDIQFMKLVEELLARHIADPDFSVDDFAAMTNTGRTLFFKKIKSLTGHSPNEFIRYRRMKMAAELLKTYKYNVSEVSYMVGINDPFYFSKCFKAQFGCSPSKYLNS